MKPSALVSVWTDLHRGGLLRWALWLLAFPATLAVVVMLLWPERGEAPTYQPLQQLDRWIEPLPAGATFDQEGFRALLHQRPDFAQVSWQAVALPDVAELALHASAQRADDLARAWYRYRFEVPANASPVETWALYGTRIQGGAYSVWANGQLVKSLHQDWRGQWISPPYVTLPLSQTQPGQAIELMVAIPYRISQGYSMGSFYFGKSHELRPIRDVREFFHRTLPLMSLVLGGLMGALSVLLWTQRRTEREHLWLALLSVAVILCNLQFTHDFSADLQVVAWYNFVVDAATNWLFMLFVVFVLRFQQLRLPGFESGLTLFTVAITLVTTPLWDWQVNGLRLQHYAVLALYLGVAMWLTWRAAVLHGFDHILFCGAMWFFMVSGWHDLTYLTSHANPDAIFIFPYGAFMLFVVAEVLMQRRYVDALGQIEANNQQLAARLRQREAEVVAQQGSLVQAQRERALTDERDRLIQEIHDGIGSVLMNSLASLVRERPTPAQAQPVVQNCLDEVTMVAASLTPPVGTVGALFESFGSRWQERLARAGLQLRWSVNGHAQAWALTPPQALDLTRVVQEAVTNAIKHANASTIQLTASANAGQGLCLSIQDDGTGYNPAVQARGRGLKHMASRVARLGGQLRMNASPGLGVGITIELPTPLAASANAGLAA